MEGTLEVRDGEVRLNDEVVATRPSSGSTVWGPVTLHPDRTDIDLMDLTGRLFSSSQFPLHVKNSRLRAWENWTPGHLIDTRAGSSHTYLTDCSLDARSARANCFGHRLTFTRCDLTGGEDVVDLWSDVNFYDCYLHDMTRLSGSHNDIFQCGGATNSGAHHCTLLAAKPVAAGSPKAVEFPDGWYDPFNAVLMIGNYGGSVNGVTIEDCLVDGGNYTFNDNWQTSHPVNQIIVRNNRFGRHFRYGPKSIHGPAWIWENNVWDDTGESV